MNIIVPEEEVREISIEEAIKSNDSARIVIKGEGQGTNRGEGREELVKQIIAHDAIALGPSEAARIHGVDQASASRYHDGLDIKDEDIKSDILATRHNIADKATAKLMQALDLFDPTCIEKHVDIVKAAASLAGIVERVTGKDKGGNEVKLILYAPKQVNVEKYEVIDV
jgi:hypothetical protein